MKTLDDYVAYYLKVCQRSQVEKENAWRQVLETAAKYPEILGAAPALLTQRMKALQASNGQRTEGNTHDALRKKG